MAAVTATKTRPKTRRDISAEMTTSVLEALEAGTVSWQKTWHVAGLPINLDSGKTYRGWNIFVLELTRIEGGYSSNRWGTYKQISERGGQVRKGQEGTTVTFWKRVPKKVDAEDGGTKTVVIPFLAHYTVFNEEQADWDPEADRRRPSNLGAQVDPIQAAEALLNDYLSLTGPSLSHGGDRAFYRPATDAIWMPPRDSFFSAEAYYATLYHEAIHSTGHSRRLARKGIAEGTFGAFGDPTYSFEELVAEMGAAILCAIAGIDQAAVIPNTAAYLAHWIKALKGDNKLIVTAAAQAQKAVDLICGTTFEDGED